MISGSLLGSGSGECGSFASVGGSQRAPAAVGTHRPGVTPGGRSTVGVCKRGVDRTPARVQADRLGCEALGAGSIAMWIAVCSHAPCLLFLASHPSRSSRICCRNLNGGFGRSLRPVWSTRGVGNGSRSDRPLFGFIAGKRSVSFRCLEAVKRHLLLPTQTRRWWLSVQLTGALRKPPFAEFVESEATCEASNHRRIGAGDAGRLWSSGQMISERMLAWPRSRCGIRMNARPVSAGRGRKNCSKASRPPPDAPMPTT